MSKYLRAELIKLTTVRSTWVCFGLVVVLAVGIGALASGASPSSFGSGGRDRGTLRTVALHQTMFGMNFAQLVVMVFGALVICGEYRFGVIRTTFTVAPRRWRLVLAKFIAVAALSALVGLVSTSLAFAVGASRLSSHGVSLGLGDDGVLRALAGTVVFFMASALFALAIGALVRNQVAALSIVLLYSIVIEPIATALLRSSSATEGIAKYLPFQAGSAIQDLDQRRRELSLRQGWPSSWR